MATDFKNDDVLDHVTMERALLLAQESINGTPAMVDALEALMHAYHDDDIAGSLRISEHILSEADSTKMPTVWARTKLMYGTSLLFSAGDPTEADHSALAAAVSHIEDGIKILERDELRALFQEELATAHHNLAQYYATFAKADWDDGEQLAIDSHRHARDALACYGNEAPLEVQVNLRMMIAQGAWDLAAQRLGQDRDSWLEEVTTTVPFLLKHISKKSEPKVIEWLRYMLAEAKRQKKKA
jgi:hypothetical protein